MSQREVFKTLPLALTTIGDNIAVPLCSGSLYIWKILFTVSAPVNITFKSGATAITGAFTFTGNGSAMTLYYDGSPHFVTQIGQDFVMNLSASVNVNGIIHYTTGRP